MVRDDLIGKEIQHKRHGRSIIQGFHNSPRDNHLYIELLFDDAEVRSFDFSEGTLSEKDFEIEKSVSDAIGEVFFKNKDGILLESSDIEDTKYTCRRCHKPIFYSKEEQIKDMKAKRKRSALCKDCIYDEKFSISQNEIRQLMKHDKKRDSKWRYIHDTDGMHVD